MTPALQEPQQTGELDTPLPETKPRFGENNRDLPDQLVQALISATRKAQNEEKFLRRIEALRDRKNRFYERGHQHIYECDEGFRLAIPGAPWSDTWGNEYEWGDFIDDYNIFFGFLWVLQSVLTQTPTGIEFEGIDPSKPEDNQAAETADGLRKHFDRMNDTRLLARETVRMMCLSGRFVRWVETVENVAKYGRKADGTPNKERVCKVYGSLESKVPIACKDQTEFRYLILYDDIDVLNAKDKYDWIRRKIKAGEMCLAENNYERYLRLGVLQGATSEFQAGESISHLLTRGNVWLRPSAFADEEFDKEFTGAEEGDLIDDGEGGKKTPSIRDVFASLFPEGVHVVFLGQSYAESWAESMDDCVFTGRPFADDSQFAIAVMDPATVPQDKFNDQMNYVAETFAFGAPRKYVMAGDQEFAAIQNQKAQPYAFTQLKQRGDGLSAEDMVHQDPNPEIPQTMQPYVQFLMGELLQFILACPPSIWGEFSDANKTATGQQLATNQARGRLGVLWSVLQNADARMYYQVAISAANDPDVPEEITVPVSNGQNVTIRLDRLRKGHFMARPDEDSGFPDSTNQVRGILQQILTMLGQISPGDPQLLMEFLNPNNLREIMRTYGLSNFVLPQAEAAERQTEEIEELLDGVPSEPTDEEIAEFAEQQAQMAAIAVQNGLPAPPPFNPATARCDPSDPMKIGTMSRPSVSVKPWDFDQPHLQQCDDYLNGDACRIELQVGRPDPETGETVPNIRGIQNVWLHREEHKKAIAAKTPAMHAGAPTHPPIQSAPHLPKPSGPQALPAPTGAMAA